jgi:hypothetical protein
MKECLPHLVVTIGVLFGIFYGFASVRESFEQRMRAKTVMINYDAPITEKQIENVLGIKEPDDDDCD